MTDIDWSQFKPADAPDRGASSVDWAQFKPAPPAGKRGYLSAAAESGGRSLLAAGATVLDALNPFTTSEEDAAVLYKNDPEGFKKFTEKSASAVLQRFAESQVRKGQDAMRQANPAETGAVSGKPLGDLKYATTDADEAAYLSPTRVAGDVLQSLPSTLALAVSGYLTRGQALRAAAQAEQAALARGLSAAEAKAAATTAAKEAAAATMAKTGAVGEGTIGFGQQAASARVDALDVKPEVYQESPEYKQLLSEGYDPEVARRKLAAQVGTESGITAGVVDAATNLVGGRILGKVIGEGGKLLPRVAKGVGAESATEFVQSGGEQFGQNVAMTSMNPNQALGENVLESSVAGGVVGGVTGGAVAGVFGSRTAEGGRAKPGAPLGADPLDAGNLALKKTTDVYLHGPSEEETAGAVVSQGSVSDAIEVAKGAAGTMDSIMAGKSAVAPVNDSQTVIGIPALAERQAGAVAAAQAQLGINPGQPLAPDARTAEQITADAAAKRSEAGQRVISEMGETLPRFQYTPALQGNQEQAPAPVDRPTSYVEQLRATATPQAKAFVHLFDTGRVTRQDVQDLIDRQDQQAAAAVAPSAAPVVPSNTAAPAPTGLVVSEGSKPRGERAVDGRPLTAQDLTPEGTAARLAGMTPAPALAPTGLVVEEQGGQRAAFRGRNDAIRQGDLPPRPQKVGGVPVADLTDDQLKGTRDNQALPAVVRRGAAAELQHRGAGKTVTGAAVGDVTVEDASARLAAAAAQAPAAAPASGIILPSGKRNSEQRLAGVAAGESKPDKPVTITQVDPATLSERRSAGTGELSRQVYGTIKQIARVFGKKLVVFDSTNERTADGFIFDDDPNTIYINRKAEKPHLVVFGHELMHGLKRNNPAAYAAVAKVVKINQGVDLNTIPGIKEPGTAEGQTEELVSDLQGNRFAETDFWADVFREVAGDSPAGKQAVMKLAAAAMKAVNRVMKALGRPAGYDSDNLVENLGEVKTAIQQALATYAKDRYADAVAMDRAERGQVPAAQGNSATANVAGRVQKTGGNVQVDDDVYKDSSSAVDDKDSVSAVGDRRLPERAGPPTRAQMAARRAREDMGAIASEKRLVEDIPNEGWLQGKIDHAEQKGRNRFGVPAMSTVTGYFPGPVDVSVRVLSKLKGQRDEQNNRRQDSLEYIRKNWDEVSKQPPYVEVAYNGEAWVSEGSHRIMVAQEKGVQSLPVEIRYFDGGQRRNGPLAPGRIPSLDASVLASEKRKPGQLDQVEAYHFSNGPRKTLVSSMFGRGLKGNARDEYLNAADPRRRQRIYFYFDKGTGIKPEAGVGGAAHKATLNNIYDVNADPLKLKAGTQAKTETNVLDAGFDGYLDRLEGSQSGNIILRGPQSVPVQALPPGTRVTAGKVVPGDDSQAVKGWKAYAAGLSKDDAEATLARLQAKPGWRGYELELTPNANKFDLRMREREEGAVLASEKRDALPGAPDVKGAKGPDRALVKIAEQYAENNGIDLRRQAEYVKVDEARGRRIAAEWDKVVDNPNDPATRRAYQALADQTLAQYKALEDAGYQFYFYGNDNDPYAGNPWNAMRDLRATKSMAVYSTREGYGNKFKDSLAKGGPMLKDTGIRWAWSADGKATEPVLFNDLFRAVHDAFGHGLEGAGFRGEGEENAWQAHVRLYSGDAIAALTSETRGQNSWLNFNLRPLHEMVGDAKAQKLHPDNWETITVGQHNGTAGVNDAIFADQKTGLMPSWTWEEGRVGDMAVEESDVVASGKRKIEEGKTIQQSEPLTAEQWTDVRKIGLSRMNDAQQAAITEAEQGVQVATTRADEDSVRFVRIAETALAAMPVPQLSTVPLMQDKASIKVTPTGKAGKGGVRKARVFDVARGLRNRFLKRSGDITTEQGRETLARAMVHEALYALSKDGHAVGWYDRKVKEAIVNAAVAHPRILMEPEANFFFRVVLAVTSNGQAVRDNFSFGNSILKTWFDTGRLPEEFDNGGGARSPAMKIAFAKINRLVETHGWEKTQEELMKLRTVREIERTFDLKISGENKDTLVPTAVGMGGPKIGNFYANLSGFFDNPTMDLWFMRTVGRMAGTNMATKSGLVKYLDELQALLPKTGMVNGIDVEEIRAEIAAYKELPEDEQVDPELTIQALEKTEQYARKQYTTFSQGTGKVYEDGKTRTFDDKSPANLNARSLVNNLSALVEAPGSGSERNNLRAVVQRALTLLEQRGVKLNAADLQAVLWYYEKNLYAKLGNISESAKPWDYASAARWGVGRELGLVDVKPSKGAGSVRAGEPGQQDLERPGGVSPSVQRDDQQGLSDPGVVASEKRNPDESPTNAYDDLRSRLADGRGYSPDGLQSFLSGRDKQANPRWGYVADGGRNPGAAAVYWRGKVAGQEGYYTSADLFGPKGQRRFLMPLVPADGIDDESQQGVIEAYKAGRHAMYIAARETSPGSWEVVVDGARSGTPLFNELTDAGQLTPAANGFYRLKLPGGTTEFDLLREATRRLSALLGGETPSISFNRETGANPRKAVVTFSPERLEARFSVKREPFFSALQKSVEGLATKAAPAAAWRDAIKGLVNKGLVKQDEVEWSGVSEWLALQDAKVTRVQVVDYLKANGVQVTETNLNDGAFEPDFAIDDFINEMAAKYGKAAIYDIDGNARTLKEDFPFMLSEEDQDAFSRAQDEVAARAAAADPDMGTKYGSYQLPGGTNYREVLLTLPGEHASALAKAEDARLELRKVYDQAEDIERRKGRDSEDYKTAKQLLTAAQQRYAQAEDALDSAKSYKSGHWDQPNIVAHIRVNDRTDADGKRVLFVEEIQSDWAQEGKKKGIQRGEQMDGGQVVYDPDERNRVPNAPFIDKTDKWVGLALKRVVKMAVDEGYDRVAFVNGDQSAERYDLSQQIGKLVYNDKFRELSTYGLDGRFVDERLMSLDEAADYIGKDIAQRLANTEPVDGKRTLEGLDLKVGGEGMKAFYDKIVPAAVKDVLRKLGGEGLTTVDISLDHDASNNEMKEWTGADRAVLGVLRNGGEIYVSQRGQEENISSEEELRQYLSDNGTPDGYFLGDKQGSATQIGFDVTDKMREKAGPGLPLFSAKRDQTETPQFKAWFKDSKARDGRGEPQLLYTGTSKDLDFKAFKIPKNGAWFTTDPKSASEYAKDNDSKGVKYNPDTRRYEEQNSASRVIPVYLRAENPYTLTEDEMNKIVKASNYKAAQGQLFDTVRARGYDSVNMGGGVWVALKEPTQIKSAIGNNGSFNPAKKDIVESAKRVFADSGRQYTPEQLKAFNNTGRVVEEQSLRERLNMLTADWKKKVAQGLVDQFAPIKDLGAPGKAAYALARLSKGSSGAVEALLHHGKLKVTADGVYDADRSGGIIERLFAPLAGETADFLSHVAANRAERLSKEDRENLFTPADIAALKSLNQGTMRFDYTLQHGPNAGQVTRDRTLVYADALKTFNEYQKNVLDVAQQSGLIDKDSRQFWEHEFYVPFYRQGDDGGFAGVSIKDGLVRQKAFERLKGGKDKLKSDMLDSVLQNMAHLIDASAKNRAALATIDAAQQMSVAYTVPSGTKGSVWVMRDGQAEHYAVEDPYTLAAISSISYSGLKGFGWDMLTAPKRWLTLGVTASPAFKVRNLIRDSISAIGVSELSPNIVKNLRDGWKAGGKDNQTFVSALAGGGLIRFGTMLEGRQADRVRQLVKQAKRDGHMLDSESSIRRFYDLYMEPAVAAYNELGNRSEEVNRIALYDQLIKKGMSPAEANLAARDLMDFSMMGAWGAVRFLTQVVPFLNARIQGLYKLGRGAAEHPGKFAVLLGAVAMAGVALMAAYSDDDRWKKLEDWERNGFWNFWIGGAHWKIPKPFEIGAIATLAERGIEFAFNPDMTGKRYAKTVRDLLMDNLAMNPVPQAVKPIIDLYANYDSFTGRPIENLAMQRLRPEYRMTANSSMTSRGISTAGNALASTVPGGKFLSPVQVDHLIDGYFGWLGSFVMFAPEAIMRAATDQPDRPARDLYKFATQGIVQETTSGSSYYVSALYKQAEEIEKSYATWRQLQKEGKLTEAQEFFTDHKDDIVKYKSVNKVKDGEAKFNEMVRMIERSTKLDPDEKKDRIIQLRQRQDALARTLTAAR